MDQERIATMIIQMIITADQLGFVWPKRPETVAQTTAKKRAAPLSSAKTKYDLFLNEIASPVVGPNVACRNTVHELPVRLTSLYIRIPKTP